ncbi:RCC1 and BTB domain-containing protein 1-like [Planococcus citri]|uniref:RCC1 and BTB domain-containing protein 1-like n=1 Tax=Planococcus citri TaxID=170843 RepID=UPI0031F751CE
MDIRKYFCEWKFRDNFIEQIKTFAVWRDNNRDYYGNAFIITNNNEVYAVGSIIEKCMENHLSSPESNAKTDFYEPVKLAPLCGKEIKKFVYGSEQVFIWTEEGEVFGYGSSSIYADKEQIFVFLHKVPALVGLCVVDIAIGPYTRKQNLALCDDGKLYKFELGQPSKHLIDTSAVKAKPVNVLHVEKSFFISLLENGEVMKVVIGNDNETFSDAKNKKDSCEYMIFRDSINQVDYPKITKLIGGCTDAFAVDEQGRLFVTGHDHLGQVGLGDHRSPGSDVHYTDFKHNSSLTERVVDVGASFSLHLSAALTESGKVYVWGSGRGPKRYKPQLTAFESLHEVFLYYAIFLETYKPINVDELSAVTSKPIPRMNSFKKAFDDRKFCDLFVVVEGKTIPVHKSILAVRCDHFAEVFQKDWPAENPSVLQIEEGDFKVYQAFLKYVYTDEIDDTLSFNEIIELLNLSNKYGMESLAERCVSLIQTGITIGNVVSLYERVIEMSKVTKLNNVFDQFKESCVKFAADNFFAMGISNEFAQLNEKLLRELIRDVCKQKFKQ